MEPCPPSVGYGNDKGKNFSRISTLGALILRGRGDEGFPNLKFAFESR